MNPGRSERPPLDFKGAAALIYGGARGIGRAVAREFARRGARVAIADIDASGAEETARSIMADGGEAMAMSCDVADQASVRAAAEAAEARLGDIDVVVNNVGVILGGNPQDIPLAEWQRVFNLNLFSTIRSQQIFLPKMIGRGAGHIVNTASFAGLYPYAANRAPYVASKAAIIAMTQSLALYLHPLGVRMSCFCPGPVMTGMTAGMKNWSTDSPMRGPGRQYRPIMPEQAAAILADGMMQGRLIIPTDELVWDDVRRHAEGPDDFVLAKIEAFARGDDGMPSFS